MKLATLFQFIRRIPGREIVMTGALVCLTSAHGQTYSQQGGAFTSGGGRASAGPYAMSGSVGELGARTQRGGVYTLSAGLPARLGTPGPVIAAIADFGDAPAPYPTTLAQNGARHTPPNTLYLGSSVDIEPDGQTNANANGDDRSATDDEDGVSLSGLLLPGAQASITITASSAGLVDAWADFNQDGDWLDGGEQIFTNQPVVAGANSLSFAVPVTATAGQTLARFRLSSAGGLSFTGSVADGEVEDYRVTIGPNVLPSDVAEWAINPNETIPAGNTNAFNPNQPHVVMFSEGAPRRDQLVVFLPGSGGVPKTFERFLGHAASLGFHAIGLAYPSAGSVASACGPTTNGDCYQRIREDIIYKNPKNPEVDEFNSIINRLELLLQHLTLTQPSNHWDRFYTPAGGLAWNKIIPAGHSQGAGHAGLIAKQNACARVVMFAGGDWWPVYCRPAPWNLLPSVTPPERWFSFTHYLDGGEFVPDSTQVPVWQALGQTQLGDVVNVDVEPAPYRHSHTLVSQLPPPAGVDAHNYTVNDPVTPLDADGRPLYAPAWTHLLTGAEVAPTPPNLVADSIKDFSNTQGSNNWTYGYWNRTANPASFVMTPLPMFGSTRSSVPAWIAAVATPVAVTNVMDHAAICDANRTNHTLTAIWDTGCELNMIAPATGAAQQHLPVRRWTSTVTGPIRLEGNLAMFDTGGGLGAGDGVEGIVRVNGTQVWSGTVNADDAIGITYGIDTNLVAGQFVEFVLAPRSANGEHDAARFTARIYDDCGASMAGGGEDDLRLSIQRSENGGAELSFEGRRGVAHSVKALAALGAAQPGDALITEIGFPALRERRRQKLQFTVDHPIFSVEEAEVARAESQAMPSQGFFLVSREALHTDAPPIQPGRHELKLQHECRQRRYLLFIPAGYNPANPTPLLIVFHGGGQTATQFATLHPGLIAEANANGVILVLPQATVSTHPSPGGGMVSETHWFGEDPEPGQTDYVNDVDFTLTLIGHLEAGLNLNPKRIYAAGFSNGAKFCHYLGGRTKGWFAALAPVAGYIGSRPPIPGALMEYVPPPTEPLPIMMVNGGQDTSVPYNGGASASGTVRSSVAEAVKHWITADHCASPAVTSTAGAVPSQVTTETYETCDPGTEVVLHSVQNMPHLWPDAGDLYAGAPVNFNANLAVMAFCLSHARP